MKGRLLVTVFFIGLNSYAQDFPRRDFNPAHLVDEVFSSQDLDLSYQDLYENYLQLISNPLDLNSVTDDQLRLLYILNQEQINSFMNYRKEAGQFLSIYELQTIFDADIFYKIIPFVTVIDAAQSFNKNLLRRIFSEPNNYLLFRWGRTLETQKGYDANASSSTKYLGTPDNFYSRFRVSKPGDFSVGFTLKKDAGEKLMWNSSTKYYGFDFISFHFQTLHKGRVKNLIIGDYQAQFGQGIALGSAFGIGKNSEAVNTMRKSNLGFLPYTSIYESGGFKGAVISYSLSKRLTLHSMVSMKGRDGKLQSNIIASSNDFISSLSYSGLHRSASEIANRNTLTETNLASILQFKNQSIDVGILGHHTIFSLPMQRSPSIYNQFQFNGNANTNVSGFLNFNLSSFAFFSEFTQTINGGHAVIAGILGSLTPKLDATIVYRKFDKNFYGFYSNAIAENTSPQNESGVYWGFKYSFNKNYSVSGYFDMFSFPWLKYRSYSPSFGSEWLLRFNYRPSKHVSIYLQARQESKARNTEAPSNLYITSNGIKQSSLVNFDYAANSRMTFRTRAQFSAYSINRMTTLGSVLLQDVSYEFGRWSVSARYAMFDTDNYDNRIYVYERDSWLAFTFPSYYGKGIRKYVLVQYRVSKHVDIWARWGQTQYVNTNIIGSGGESIAGDMRNDVKFQARIRF